MNLINRKVNVLFLVVVFCSSLAAASTGLPEGVSQVFRVKIRLFSYIEGQQMTSYDLFGVGESSGGCSSWGVYDGGKPFRVSVSARSEKDSLIAVVGVMPRSKDKTTEKKTFKIDLSDLHAKSVVVAKDDNGRCYVVSLTPFMTFTGREPEQLSAEALKLDNWSFDGSIVLFNDSEYVGKLSMYGGPMAYVVYPGIAKVTFSLLPFEGGQRLGTLEDGKIRISNSDGQTLEIYNVKNGLYHTLLPGGDYGVWVNWQNLEGESEYKMPSKEQWIKMFKKSFINKANIPPSDEELAKMYEKVKNVKQLPLSSGVGKFKIEDVK